MYWKSENMHCLWEISLNHKADRLYSSCSFQILLQSVALCRIQTWGDKSIIKVLKKWQKGKGCNTHTYYYLYLQKTSKKLKITRLGTWIINNWDMSSLRETNNTTISSGLDKIFDVWGIKTTIFTVYFSL